MTTQPTQEAPSSDVVEAAKECLRDVLEGHAEYDSRLCCDGHECGCQGATVFQGIQHYFDSNITAALASTAGDTLKAENERLRAALERAEQDLSCRDGSGHYCPNCDRSGFDTLQAIRTALGSDQ